MNLLTVGRISIGYFVIFSIIYIIKLAETFLLYMKYHSTLLQIDITQTLDSKFAVSVIPGSMVFDFTGCLAVIAWMVFLYVFVWNGENLLQVSR